MTKTVNCILILLFIIMSLLSESVFSMPLNERKSTVAPKIRPTLEIAIVNQINRNKLIKIDRLMDEGIIRIKPGMVILDIGTGAGFFAYKFAERLQGTGRVFATDLLSDRIDYIKQEAQKRGLRNLYPVLVDSEGMDAFYSKNRYDLIFTCHVYHCFKNRISYFKKMKDFLTEDGELVVILYKSVPFFQPDDIVDFKGLIKELSRELPENAPFYKRLRGSTQESIKQRYNKLQYEKIRNIIIEDFNQELFDPYLYNEFQSKFINKTVSFYPAEKDLYNWLLMCLKEDGVFDKAQTELSSKDIRAIIKINKLLFLQRFRRYFPRDKKAFFYEDEVHNQTSKFLVERELNNAGYILKNEYNALPYHDILFFTVNKDKNAK